MPPAAATPAARRTAARPVDENRYTEAYARRSGQATHTTHVAPPPRRVAAVAAPAGPRRVASLAAPARPAPARPRTPPSRARTAPHTAPAPPRRPRAPTPNPRPIRVERPARPALRAHRPVPLAGLVIRLPRGGKVLDSIIRGRAWIPMLGVLLLGIVGMRVEVLKLGSSVGSEMQQASLLQSTNAELQNQVSALSTNQRIEQLASRQGMVMPGPLDVHFVHASGAANVSEAIADISEPSPSAFLDGVVSERAQDGQTAVTAATTSAIGVLGGGSISSNPTSSSTSGSSGTAGTSGTTAQTTTTSAAQSSNGTVATQGATSSPPGSTASSTSDTAAATDNVTAATSTESNGAASLGG